MTERNDTEITEINDVLNEQAEREKENKSPEEEMTEFKITVRKLEMPVRPRGVLAE